MHVHSLLPLQCLGPFAFYDVNGVEQVPDNSSSLVNKTEAEMVMSLFLALVQRYPQLRASSSIAVISPYKAQVRVSSPPATPVSNDQ